MVVKAQARALTKEEQSMAMVHAAQSKLEAEAGELGNIYDTCSHAWVMIRETAVEELSETLRDGSKEEKEVALAELLGQIKHSKVRYIREQSAKGMGSIAAVDVRVRDALVELLADEDAAVREATLIALRTRLQSDQMVEAIQNAQKGVLDAFEAERPMIERVHELIPDVNGRVRFNAIDALRVLVKRFHTESIAEVATRLRDEEAWVRRHAAEMLCVALHEAEEAKKQMSKSSIVFISEGYQELLNAVVQCYEVGLTVFGGGDIYLRHTAVKGLMAAALAEADAGEADDLTSIPEDDSDEEDNFVGANIRPPTPNKKEKGDAMGTLKRCLQDTNEDVRDAAAKALLKIALTGNRKAVDAVMSDVECILAHGLGVPGLGVKGTPEAAARGQLHGQDGMGTREQQRRDMLEQVEMDKALAAEEQRSREQRLQKDLDALKVLSDNGFISKLRETAFPPSEEALAAVLAEEEADPERVRVRQEAAELLFRLCGQENEKAAMAAASNLDHFLHLTGKYDLGRRAARLVHEQQQREAVRPPPKPQTRLCEELRGDLETTINDDGVVPDEEVERRKQAAVLLSELAEHGDAAAAAAVLDDGKAFLQGLYDAGLLSDKTLKTVMAAPRSM